MKSKLFKRLIKKNLEADSIPDLISRIQSARKGDERFFEDMAAFFESVDKAIVDLEKVIEIRDRSLAISSAEMTTLNNEIKAQSERQMAVLERLQTTVNLLGGARGQEAHASDLEKLVGVVTQLVRAQKEYAEMQKLLYEEGLKICSCNGLYELEQQLGHSFARALGQPIKMTIYFRSSFFQTREDGLFYACDDQSQPYKVRTVTVEQAILARSLAVNSPQGHGCMAYIQLLNSLGAHDPGALEAVAPLLPNVAATLENLKLHQDEKHQLHLENELNTIRLVQQTLLPQPASKDQYEDLEVAGYYQSASECGGDWWTHFRLLDGRYVVLVGDVTGHGTGSAMVCAVVKGYCDSFLSETEFRLINVLTELNTVVYRISKDTRRVMTLSAALIDTAGGRVTFANAGHPLPLLLRSSDKEPKMSYLTSSGPILGFEPESSFSEVTYDFRRGDKLIFYSDGLTECMDARNTMYGDGRLRRLLMKNGRDASAEQLNHSIIEDVRKFAAGETLKDDLTAVVVRNMRA